MKFEILIIFFVNFLIQDVISQSASCYYYTSSTYGYTCDMTLINPNGFDNFTTISGTHLSGKTNDDVLLVYSDYVNYYSNSTNFPSIICQKFRNTLRIVFLSSGIEKISDHSFNNCANLNYLDLRSNKITGTISGQFSGLLNLEELYLDGNRISEIWEYTFFMNVNLKTLSLHDNEIKALSKSVFTNQNKIENLIVGHNRITDLPPNIFSSLTKISSLDLSGNNLTTIHSDSFGAHNSLKTFHFHSNNLDAFDERIINDTNISVINGAHNPCILSHGIINDTSVDRTFIRMALMLCFMNYEEREGDTTTTITESTTAVTTTTNSNHCIIGNLDNRVCYLEDESQETRQNIEKLRQENQEIRYENEEIRNEMIKMNEKILELTTRPCQCK